MPDLSPMIAQTLHNYARRLACSAPWWLVDEEDLYHVGVLAWLRTPSYGAAWGAMVDQLRHFGPWDRAGKVRVPRAPEGALVPSSPETASYARQLWARLSPRERGIVRAVCLGYSQREIAGQLGYTEGRISQLRRVIAHKCQEDTAADTGGTKQWPLHPRNSRPASTRLRTASTGAIPSATTN